MEQLKGTQTSEDQDEVLENMAAGQTAMSSYSWDAASSEDLDEGLENLEWSDAQTVMNSLPKEATYHLQRTFIAYGKMAALSMESKDYESSREYWM